MITFTVLDELTPPVAMQLHDTIADWLNVAEDIKAGRAQLLQINGGASFAVTRIEHDIKELVVCAYAGRDVCDFGEAAVKIAEKNNLESVRFHTRRVGLGRLLKQFGPVLEEMVYRVRL